MTAILGFVPSRLFDSDWTAAKRSRLVKIALDAAERVAQGVSARVVSVTVINAPDIETALGRTDGDLDGGELAPDQALGFRPMAEWQDGRTSIRGLYLGGPSAAPSPFVLGGSLPAAEAIIVDIRTGWIR
jgi:phytoene dehydrogenase-like protein